MAANMILFWMVMISLQTQADAEETPSVILPGPHQSTALDDSCGGWLDGLSGTFQSPGYPNTYPNNARCTWIIQLPDPNLEVQLTFLDVELEGTSCSFDAIKVYDGGSTDSPLLGSVCSNDSRLFYSSGQQLTVLFYSDSSVTKRGFQASYNSVANSCGGLLQGLSGTFQSPGYPNTYPNSARCVWIIQLPASNLEVQLRFLDVELEGTTCQYDAIKIYDGGSTDSPLLGSVCSNDSRLFYSSGPQLTVLFYSDGSVTKRGFQASYNSVASSCGGLLQGLSGTFQSPGYPNTYPNNARCVWFIQLPDPNYEVQLRFLDVELEGTSCSYDAIKVYDGGSTDSPLLGSVCSNDSRLFYSSGQQLTVLFYSDSGVTKRGFQASYNSVASSCGGLLQGLSGTFQSPGYPNTYPNNARCVWFIQLPDPNYEVQLRFLDVELEGTSCSYDAIKVYDGGSTDSPLLGSVCSNDSRLFYSSGQQLTVLFYSDSSVTKRGFQASYNSVTDSCGGLLQGLSGTLQSPGYPSTYPNNARCVWFIQLPASNLEVQLTFLDVELEGTSCSFDAIKIYDGGSTDSPLLGSVCSNDSRLFYSSGQQLTVLFYSDSSVTKRGFQASYNSVASSCGGLLQGLSGTFQSPGYPNTYPNSARCVWIIQLPASNLEVQLRFLDVELEGTTCQYDAIKIYDGGSTDSPLLGSVCSNDSRLFYSSGPQLTVLFYSDGSVTKRGFQASYNSGNNSCGGLLQSLSGSFQSPGYPNAYPNDAHCVWHIQLPEQNLRVELQFLDVELEGTTCQYDAIEVYDGGFTDSPLLGSVCSNNHSVFTSSGSQLTVLFRSDFSVTRRGFEASYSSFPASNSTPGNNSCGGLLQDLSGSFQSPGYPNAYPNDAHCVWHIQLPEQNLRVELQFLDVELEGTTCQYDAIEVYDGGFTDSPLLGSVCSNNHSVFTSSGSQLTVLFRSDFSVTRRGFEASYSSFPASNSTPGNNSCGGLLQDLSGSFQSPGYPNAYPNDAHCVWHIQLPEQNLRVELQFLDVELEGTTCQYDAIEVYDGGFTDSPLLGSVCSNNHSVFTSSGSQLTVLFRSDFSVTRRGFEASYSSFPASNSTPGNNSCGGLLQDLSGSFQSPGYPNAYPNDAHCVWHIQLPEQNLRVELQFLDVELEGTTCQYDAIEVYDGGFTDSPLLGSVCSNNHSVFTSSGSQLTVLFRSDFSVTRRGFEASYSSFPASNSTPGNNSCGGLLQDLSGSFQSPGYPNAYPNDAHCVWHIQLPEQNLRVELQFLDVELEGTTCQYDAIEVYDGGFTDSPLLGSVCSNNHSVFTSSGSQLTVLFRSDFSVTRRGFEASYSSFPASNSTPGNNSCGGLLQDLSGSFQSPGYPNAYPNDAHCVWHIQLPEQNLRVELQFLDVELEGTTCQYDAIEVYDGGFTDSPLLGSVCSNNHSVFTSSGSQLTVLFRSDFSVTRRGFEASYSSFPASNSTPGNNSCGGLLQDLSGSFQSPGYPNAYPNDAHCVWHIQLPEQNLRVELQFLDVELEGTTCQYDAIEVYDGGFTDSPLLGSVCSNNHSVFTSSGSQLTVLFRSDFSVTRRGFEASYSSFPASNSTPGNNSCGGLLQDLSGSFQSPGYPNAYPNDAHCVWHIQLPEQNLRVELQFLDVELEGTTCQYDAIEVYDGGFTDSPLLGSVCSNNHSVFTSSGSQLTVLFRSDFSVTRRGFEASYSSFPASNSTPGNNSCGGLLQSLSGSFQSPGYPNAYPNDAHCVWIIQLPEQNLRVELQFLDVELEGTTCQYDAIKVYDGGSTDSPLLGSVCSNDYRFFTSSGSQLTVLFRSDYSVAGRGFDAYYTSLLISNSTPGDTSCGGLLQGLSGSFQSPGYPNNYPNDARCVWRIQLPDPDLRVELQFLGVELEGTSCMYDAIEVYDGGSPSSPLLASVCSNDARAFFSSGPQLTILFRTDSSITARGFEASYSSFPASENNPGAGFCGGLLQGLSGSFQSPGYPNAYPNNARCEWTIQLPEPNLRVELQFLDVELEGTTCQFDAIEVYDGGSTDSPLLGSVCSNNHSVFNSSGSQLTVLFHTDLSITRRGFEASYHSFPGSNSNTGNNSCGGLLQGLSGSFQSPGYPNDYPNDAHCVWHIQLPQLNLRVELQFLDVELEGTICQFDVIDVYDGGSIDSPLLGSVCSNSHNVFNSSGSQLTVLFRTDSTVTQRGFEASYRSFLVSNSTAGNNSCGGLLQGLSGSFQSPGYPNDYPNNARCVWIIQLPEPNLRVELQFLDVELEGTICQFDTIEVYDGRSTDSPLLGSVCSNNNLVFYSAGPQLTVLFRTDSSTPARGFEASYHSFLTSNSIPGNNSCGGLLQGLSGSFQSPGYPNTYPNSARCVWHIQLPEQNLRVELQFLDVELEGTSCRYDAIEVYDGGSIDGPFLGSVCSNDHSVFSSLGPQLTVLFRTDSSVTLRGFEASYSSFPASNSSTASLRKRTPLSRTADHEDRRKKEAEKPRGRSKISGWQKAVPKELPNRAAWKQSRNGNESPSLPPASRKIPTLLKYEA
ncbi:cubilin isoform X1 [Columba livia]|uniref:cubilin isoform X1 n=1 Tax=Columba livia TaxID=8932 RepID=UPI0031BA58AF